MMTRAPAQDADARLTADRDEIKYLVAATRASELVSALRSELSPHRFRGEGANLLPGARHYVTTTYFDTPSRDLYRTACGSPISIKLRAKEYYDLHPSLAEVATDLRALVRHQPIVWLEIKRKEGTRTTKVRVGVPRGEVSEFLEVGRVTPQMARIQARFGSRGRGALDALSELCQGFHEPLRPDCLVHYRRLAWQDRDGTLRITLDSGLSFFAPPIDLWTRRHALVRETLGQPAGVESSYIVEVKARGAPPVWLPSLLLQLGATRRGYSKFEEASRTLHG